MATFQYEAMNAAGQEVKAEIEAQSSDEAITKIRQQGYFPTKVKERAAKKVKGAAPAASGKPAKKGGGAMNISFGRVGLKQITQMTRQLSTLQDAGLPILRSLKVLYQQQKPGQLRTILDAVATDVEGGATLSEAMSRHPKAFDRLYVNMVAAGETGGVLDVILQRLAEFMEKAQRLKRKVVGALIYPTVVITFSVAIVTGIMYFVVPRFREIFADFRTDLPWPTKVLINISDFIANEYGWLLILGAPDRGLHFLQAGGEDEDGQVRAGQGEAVHPDPGADRGEDEHCAVFADAGDAAGGGRADSGGDQHHEGHVGERGVRAGVGEGTRRDPGGGEFRGAAAGGEGVRQHRNEHDRRGGGDGRPGQDAAEDRGQLR